MTETRHSLNPEPRNVLVKVKSKKTVHRDGRAYAYGELFRATEYAAAQMVAAGLVDRA
jgi:hypothetical protein